MRRVVHVSADDSMVKVAVVVRMDTTRLTRDEVDRIAVHFAEDVVHTLRTVYLSE